MMIILSNTVSNVCEQFDAGSAVCGVYLNFQKKILLYESRCCSKKSSIFIESGVWSMTGLKVICVTDISILV
jgi:hypothetical protein